MVDVHVRTATAADLEAATACIAAAFEDDPVVSAVIPPDRRLARLRRLFRPQLAESIAFGDVVMTSDATAVAMWSPPDRSRLPVRMVIRSAIPTLLAGGRRLHRLASLLVHLERDHPRTPRHWYLNYIGAVPAARGRGIGSVLLRHTLDRCDAEGMPAYLESSNPRNVPFYLRHGFQITGDLAYGRIPPLQAMWRHSDQTAA